MIEIGNLKLEMGNAIFAHQWAYALKADG